MAPLLHLDQLSLVRNGIHILRDICWQIYAGQHWAILGANGSGKSSLLNCVTGHISPTKGTMAVSGHTFGHTDWREIKKTIGWVSHSLSRNITPSETALSIIASGPHALLNINNHPITPEDLDTARDLLTRHGITHLTDSRWAWMSQGERQKCLIARAFAARFTLLFLDEPCTGLDPVARQKFLNWLEELHTHPHAPPIVMVSHHVEDLPRHTSHALLLKNGTCFRSGPAHEYLNSSTLSSVFNAPVHLTHTHKSWHLTVP